MINLYWFDCSHLIFPERQEILSRKKSPMKTYETKKHLKCLPMHYTPYFFKLIYAFPCAWMLHLHVCMCTTCASGAYEGQKRISESLELEFTDSCEFLCGVLETQYGSTKELCRKQIVMVHVQYELFLWFIGVTDKQGCQATLSLTGC